MCASVSRRLTAFPASRVLRRLLPHGWLLVLLGALGFLAWTTQVRVARVAHLSGLASWSVDALAQDAHSPTGYVGEQRRLIVPGSRGPGNQWIIQTQQMLHEGTWRVRHVDYDNAPDGRATHATAPYRWWLALVGRLVGALKPSTMSPGLAVERGALYADPLLRGLLVLSTTLFAARCFGPLAASLVAFAAVAVFPLAGGFQPGAPDAHVLAWLCVVWSVLPLATALRTRRGPARSETDTRRGQRRWFGVAGVAGGLGMWVDATSQAPILAGLALGGFATTWLAGRKSSAEASISPPWRVWAVSGAVTCLVGYLFEYFPGHLSWEVQGIHALHGVTWLGLGEMMARAEAYFVPAGKPWRRHDTLAVVLAVLAVLSLPAAVVLKEGGRFLADDLFARQLTDRPDGVTASSVGAWLLRDGFSNMFGAVSLPVLLVVPAIILAALRRRTPASWRMIVLTLGPVIVALAMAWFRLQWWNAFDAVWLVLLPIATDAIVESGAGPSRGWSWCVLVVALLAPGLLLQIPPRGSHAQDPLNERDVLAVLERDLAYWLVKQMPNDETPVVFTTPALTTALAFHGGIKGIGTFDSENESGFNAAMRIASATTHLEARTLLESRGVTHIVVPSWDSMLDEYVRLGRRVPPGRNPPVDSFAVALQAWKLPPWLQAVPYHIPRAAGFEGLSVAVFEIVSEQSEALAASRLASYFLEMEMLGHAAGMRDKLGLYPRDLAALVSIAQVELALGAAADFSAALDALLPFVDRRAARRLPFDRRVNLGAVLAQGKRLEAARAQVESCLAEIDKTRIRDLTTSATVRLLALCNLFDLEFSDPGLRDYALALLPPDLRAQVAPGTNPGRRKTRG